MNNYKHYEGDAFEFYEKVFAQKRGKSGKNILESFSNDIKSLYKNYDNNFDQNSLQILIKNDFSIDVCTQLKDLYKYSAKTFVDLRTELTTTKNGRKVECQYCTLGKVHTFDHYIPKGEFAEFSVHPKNLLCCCAECNSLRGSKWRKDGKLLSLNLYKDILPKEQYLFVSINDVKSFDFNFYLENKSGIDDELFKRIEYHYKSLKLFDRFGESSDNVISSFYADLKAFQEYPLSEKSKEIVLKQIHSQRLGKGFNYWESILKLALLDDKDFMNSLR